MINTFVRLMAFPMLMVFSMMMVVAAPAYSASAVQFFYCEEGDDADEEKIEAAVSAWLKAARKVKGAENLQAFIHYPVAASMPGETDLFIMIVAPSMTEWGMFWDGYKGSEAAEMDAGKSGELIICPSSALFESVKIE